MADPKGKVPPRTTLRMGTAQANTPSDGTLLGDDSLDVIESMALPRDTAPREAVGASSGSSRFLDPKDPRLATKILPKVQAAPEPDPVRNHVWVATHERPPSPDPRLILLRDPDSNQAAAFRVLRHRLASAGDPRVIVVSSANRGDGKTTTAVNLAMALGECNRARVLLIEANLRTPSLAKLFGFQPPVCFSEQLAVHRERPLEQWSIVEVYSPALHVLAVDPVRGGRPLLDVPAYVVAMDTLRRSGYDYIVIDTPPILGSADVNLIEEQGDGLLMVVRAGETRARAIRSALDQVGTSRFLGFAMLDV